MDLIREAWGIVEDTMIVGLGVDQYRTISFADTPVHNMYLLLWAEGGLLALLGWLLLMTISALVAIGVYQYDRQAAALGLRSEEHTSELQSLMRISYAVFCLQNKKIMTLRTL